MEPENAGQPQEHAEQQLDTHTPSHWQASKQSVQDEQDIRESPLPTDGAATVLEDQPDYSAPTNPIHAQFPAEDLRKIRFSDPETYAAGIPAAIRSAENMLRDSAFGRASRALVSLNKSHGIDCMSCAWPEPDGPRRILEFCENGAKAVAWEADSRKCGAEFFATHTIAELANQHDYWLGQQGRLTEPMVLREGCQHYEPISWPDAYRMIADELNKLTSPDEAVFYTSGRASNEAAFLYGVFARHFGTNNMPDCSNMCHESSGSALTEQIGIGKGTVTIEDYGKAQVIMLVGHNPGTNHPRMLTTLAEAKQKGAKIITINPLIEAGLLRFKDPQEAKGLIGGGQKLTDLYLQVRVNGDIPLLKGIMKEIVAIDEKEGRGIDRNFIREKTAGFDEFLAALKEEDMDTLVRESGVSREQMRAAAAMLASADRIIANWCMGLTQQKTAVHAIQEVTNLILLRGSIGKPGAGVMPVRGHSNVQGDRTMGVWERPRDTFLDQLKKTFGFEPPRHPGFDVVESIRAMHAGKLKVFVGLAGNFISATPDTDYAAEALRNTRLTVQISTKLNRSHLVTGKKALILPTLGRTEIDRQKIGEQFVTTENSMGVVETSRGRLAPASNQLMSEPAIVCNIAAATLGRSSKLDWLALAEDYDRIRDLIAQVIPGCDDYNRKVRQKYGFYLPNKPRQGNFEDTKSKKANFIKVARPVHELEPGQLVLTSIRSHDQFNTTIYGWDDVYRGIRNGRRVILMNAEDMQERGLAMGDIVNLVGHYHGQKRYAKRFVALPYKVLRGNCAGYFPEVNPLVPVASVAEKSNQPTSKFIVITVEKTGEPRVPVQ